MAFITASATSLRTFAVRQALGNQVMWTKGMVEICCCVDSKIIICLNFQARAIYIRKGFKLSEIISY